MSVEAQLCYFFGLLFSSLLNSHLPTCHLSASWREWWESGCALCCGHTLTKLQQPQVNNMILVAKSYRPVTLVLVFTATMEGIFIKCLTMRMSLSFLSNISYSSTPPTDHPPYPTSQMWGKCGRSQWNVCVPQGPGFLLNCEESPHVLKTAGHTCTQTCTNILNTLAQCICLKMSEFLKYLFLSCSGKLSDQFGDMAWLCQ